MYLSLADSMIGEYAMQQCMMMMQHSVAWGTWAMSIRKKDRTPAISCLNDLDEWARLLGSGKGWKKAAKPTYQNVKLLVGYRFLDHYANTLLHVVDVFWLVHTVDVLTPAP